MRIQPIRRASFGQDDRHAVMDERDIGRGFAREDHEAGHGHAVMIFEMINARQIQRIGVRGADGIFDPFAIALFPFKVISTDLYIDLSPHSDLLLCADYSDPMPN